MSRSLLGAGLLALLLLSGLAWWYAGRQAVEVTAPIEPEAVEPVGRSVAPGRVREAEPDVPDEPATVRRELVASSWRAAAPLGAPPGTVLVRGGETTIGTALEEVRALAGGDESLLRPLLREIPQHSVQVADFFLMVTEVTNEQYAEYVEATGARPPWTWADEDLVNGARAAFLEEQSTRRREARAKGRPIPEIAEFDGDAWWERSWKGAPWSVPEGEEALPVTFVDCAAASGYAGWAGLRLMTEPEYQRACRGDTARDFPWGDAPATTERLVSAEARAARPLAAGALPGGASPDGVLHLAGNVWEWTSSPFLPYEGCEDATAELRDDGAADVSTRWNADRRVLVGGSFQNTAFAARCTVRRPAEPSIRTDAVGFRCAASAPPGRDGALTALLEDLRASRWRDVEVDASALLAIVHWSAREGTAVITDELGNRDPLPDYAVITGCDRVLFLPAAGLGATSVEELRELSAGGEPVPLGVLSTTLPVLQPGLRAGTYVVALRAGGGGRPSPPSPESAGGEWGEDGLVFYGLEGERAASMAAPELSTGPPVEPSAKAGRAVALVEEGAANREEPVDAAVFLASAAAGSSDSTFRYELELLFAAGSITND